MSHLDTDEKDTYLSTLSPGGDLDLRATDLSEGLLDEVLSEFYDPTLRRKRFGEIDFTETTIEGDANFSHSQFDGEVTFYLTRFLGPAKFNDTKFQKYISFEAATFLDGSFFGRAEFMGESYFGNLEFESTAGFGNAIFRGHTYFFDLSFQKDGYFANATFLGPLEFTGCTAKDVVDFSKATFHSTPKLGPLIASGSVDFSLATFEAPIEIEVASTEVTFRRTRWKSKATVRLRYAKVDLSEAFFEYPVAVTMKADRFQRDSGNVMHEAFHPSLTPSVRLTSVRGVDAAHLVLTDLDLSSCIFSGAFHLDQIRMEGECTYSRTPTGVRRHGLRPTHWTPRRTIAEEHFWRARNHASGISAWRGWTTPGLSVQPSTPSALSATYRQLRKSLEDGKNEPDAADFYYGEMEMRRHDKSRPHGERSLLWIYWITSGYGLRASRALGWLLLAVIATMVSLVLWGIPNDTKDLASTGRIEGSRLTLTSEKPEPAALKVPYSERVTPERFEKALQVTLNSVIFRSSGQDLTPQGTYIEMFSRLSEPVLLGLSVLAVRGRVKR
ncbi:pentapeptide repeat-containing protein [Streptomyces sp. NPDC102282]|uniref:pentapeptide repeat-containing protein n=1 Tax=Streptomyces sp. NPDC102282 TaxID=3366154 RepID=UPI0037FC6AB1